MKYFISDQEIYSDEFQTVTDENVLYGFIERLEKNIFAADTEATGLDIKLANPLLIQIGDNIDQYAYDVRIGLKRLQPILKLLQDPSYIKVFANVKYDYKILWHNFSIHLNNVEDVLLDDRCIYNGLVTEIEEALFKRENDHGRFSLEGLAVKHLHSKMNKAVRASFINHTGDFSINQILYALDDIHIPYNLYFVLQDLLDKYGLKKTASIENGSSLGFAEMEYNGIRINTKRWNEIYIENVKELENVESLLDAEVRNNKELSSKYIIGKQLGILEEFDERDCKINWRSPPQKVKIINQLGYGEYIWVKDKKTKELKQSAGAEVLKKLTRPDNGLEQNPIIPLMVEHGEIGKSVSSYGKKFLRHVKDNNRVHTEIFQIKKTGRVGSGKPNLQNIKSDSDYRECFIASPGNTLVVADYSNMELRLIADKSGEESLIEAFLNNEDVHSKMAMVIQKVAFGRDINISKTENPHLRSESKTITFAIAYGGSAYRISDVLNIEYSKAEELLNQYFKAFPKLKVLFNSLSTFGTKYGYIRTYKPYSRIRWFPEYREYKSLAKIYKKSKAQFTKFKQIEGAIGRESSNTPIQGSAADIVKKAICMLVERHIEFNKKYGMDHPLNYDRWRLLLQVHDEIISEVKEEYAEEVANDKKFIMEMAANDVMTKLPMLAEPVITKTWKH